MRSAPPQTPCYWGSCWVCASSSSWWRLAHREFSRGGAPSAFGVFVRLAFGTRGGVGPVLWGGAAFRFFFFCGRTCGEMWQKVNNFWFSKRRKEGRLRKPILAVSASFFFEGSSLFCGFRRGMDQLDGMPRPCFPWRSLT